MFRRMLLRIGDFVFVTRPLILIPVWSFFLLGARTGRALSPQPVLEGAPDYGFICLTAIMVTAYLVNQVFDRETDLHNNKGHYLTRGILSVRTVVFMALLSFAVASITFQETALVQRVPLATALVLSLVYSLPPIRLCARPFVDLVANAVGYGGIAFLVGHLAFDPSAERAALAAAPYVFLVGATFLHTTILDVAGDRDTGKRTTTVLIGVSPSAWLALVLSVLGLVCAVAVWRIQGDVLAMVLVGISVPAFAGGALAIARGGKRDRVSSNTVQAATVAVAAAAAVVEPRYLALVVPIVVASRFYYRARFGVSYPGVVSVAGAGNDSSPAA